MPAATILSFDPSMDFLGATFRLETLALAAIVFVVLILTALRAGRTNRAAALDEATADAPRLRRDDLILMAFGAVPGAVVGGRVGYILLHLDYYQANSNAIFDPGQGSFELALGLALATLTAVSVARLLAAPVGRWLAVVAVPVFLGLGLGKLAMVLGGSGQGAYSSASYATSYAGDGPWMSANPDFPAVPSQAIEGILALAVVAGVLVIPFVLRLRYAPLGRIVRPALAPRREWSLLSGGRRYTTMLGLWAVARFGVAFTWRDALVFGPLNAEQLILIGIAAVLFGGPVLATGVRRLGAAIPKWRVALRERRARAAEARAAAVEPAVEPPAAAQEAEIADKFEQAKGPAPAAE